MIEGELQSESRSAPRMALSLPAEFIAVGGNQRCIVTNLSCSGVLIAISEPLKVGQEGYLRCGPIDHFMAVTRKDRGSNALKFEIPVSDVFVFGIRHFQERLAEHEEAELQEVVRSWTEGTNTGNR